MCVPMKAGAAANILRDRAIQLENDLRVMTIDIFERVPPGLAGRGAAAVMQDVARPHSR